MNINDLACLMGKSRYEIEKILKTEAVLELNLIEPVDKKKKDGLFIEVI